MLSLLQVMIRVWRFCWNKRFFTRLKATLSAPSTVLCKILSRLLFRLIERARAESLTDDCALFLYFRIHDNEGAAEMLIDTLGPAIVNAKDSKNRYIHTHKDVQQPQGFWNCN